MLLNRMFQAQMKEKIKGLEAEDGWKMILPKYDVKIVKYDDLTDQLQTQTLNDNLEENEYTMAGAISFFEKYDCKSWN